MSVAGPIRRTVSELASEAGEIILLVIGVIIFVWALPKLIGIGQSLIGIIPGGTSALSTGSASLSMTGSVGSVHTTRGAPGTPPGYPYANQLPYNPYANFQRQETYFRMNGILAPGPPVKKR